MKEAPDDLEAYYSKHYIHRSNWLRAAVLGANDGILSTASIAIGIIFHLITDAVDCIFTFSKCSGCNWNVVL